MNKILLEIFESREDLSDYVFHFTKGSNAREILKKILCDGAVKDMSGNGYICFSESPLTMLPAMFDIFNHYKEPMYAPYGVGFRKDWIFDKGGRPVFYVTKSELRDLPESMRWRGIEYEPHNYDFSWLREWRINASEVKFTEEDAIIIAPTSEEANDFSFELDDITLDGDVEENNTEFVGFADGKFKRKYKSVSFEEITAVNKMDKKNLKLLLKQQSKDGEEHRNLGCFIQDI